MNSLELKVPPVAVTFLTALLMWLVARSLPAGAFVVPARILFAMILALIGAATSTLGVVAFRRASTTVNPMKPEAASSLVHSGIYTVTRNPMYLGLLLILAAWGLFLANALVFLLLPVFIGYMNRFQIRPEERTLTALFGQAFVAYTARVRRWI